MYTSGLVLDNYLSNTSQLSELYVAHKECIAAKPDPMFWVQPKFGPNFWVQTGWVGPRYPKTGAIG